MWGVLCVMLGQCGALCTTVTWYHSMTRECTATRRNGRYGSLTAPLPPCALPVVYQPIQASRPCYHARLIATWYASTYAYNNNCNTIIRVFTVPHNYIVIMTVVAGYHCSLTMPPGRVAATPTTLYTPYPIQPGGMPQMGTPTAEHYVKHGRGVGLDKIFQKIYKQQNELMFQFKIYF